MNILDQLVSRGIITSSQANKIINYISINQDSNIIEILNMLVFNDVITEGQADKIMDVLF